MSRSAHTIQLATGVTLPYLEQGDPAGVPVLLLHGYSDSFCSYELMLAHLPDYIHAYALTQRGHGDADKPVAGYRVEDYVADVAAFLDAMGIEAAVIAGHSGGSYTAQRFALDHPDRTLGIVLIGSFRAFHDNAGILELRETTSQLTDPVDPEFVREFQESCVAQPVPAAFIDAIVADSCQVPARVWKDYLDGLLEAEVPTERGMIVARLFRRRALRPTPARATVPTGSSRSGRRPRSRPSRPASPKRRGGPVEEIRPGDRVYFEPGEDHWHGAAPNRFMTHLAMQEVDEQGSPVTWGEHVSDEEYGAAPPIDR